MSTPEETTLPIIPWNEPLHTDSDSILNMVFDAPDGFEAFIEMAEKVLKKKITWTGEDYILEDPK